MKAIYTKKDAPKIIGINIESKKADILKKISDEFKVDLIQYDDHCGEQQIGYLCKFKGFSSTEQITEIDKEALLFSEMRPQLLNKILDKMRYQNVTVKLKAIVTEYNQKWTVSKLLAELEKEHNIMNGGNKNDKE